MEFTIHNDDMNKKKRIKCKIRPNSVTIDHDF